MAFGRLEVNAFYLSASTVISSLLGFLFWLAATSQWSPDEIGSGVTAVSIIGMIALVSTLGTGYSIIRFSNLQQQDYERLVSTSIITSLLVGSLLGIAVVMTLRSLNIGASYGIHGMAVYLAIVVGSALSGPANIIDSASIGKRKAHLYLAKNIILGICRILLLVILFESGGVESIVGAFSLGIAGALLFGIWFCLPRSIEDFRFRMRGAYKTFKEYYHYSISSQISSILFLAPTFLLPIIITTMKGPEDAAYFYFPWMIAGIVFAVTNSISSSAFAEAVCREENLRDIEAKSVKLVLLVTCTASIGSFLIGRDILAVVGSEYSENSYSILVILVVSTIPWGLTRPYVAFLRAQDRLTSVVLASLIASLVGVGASVFFLTFLDLLFVGLAWMMANAAALAYVVAEARRSKPPVPMH